MSDFRRPLHDEFRPLVIADPPEPETARGLFDDEIAIDFPCIDGVVERMRTGLLGADDHGESHNAAVSLSRRQAGAGVTVPLEVPVRTTCNHCGGRGESWAEPCGMCAGSGACSTPREVQISVPAGVVDGTRFRFVIAPHGMPTRIEVTVLVA